MPLAAISDAIDGLSAREAEELRDRLELRLRRCAIDDQDGAVPVRISWRTSTGELRAALMLCPACLERHRLPETRAES